MIDTVKILIDSLALKQPAQQTDYLAVAVTIALLLINIASTWILYFKTYKNEYYKQIINKRHLCYELLENTIDKLRLWDYRDKKNHKEPYPIIFETWNTYYEFCSDLNRVGKKSYWLNKDTSKEIRKLSKYLSDDIDPNGNIKDSISTGVEHYTKIMDFCIQLQKYFFHDLKELHKVRKFINQKKTY